MPSYRYMPYRPRIPQDTPGTFFLIATHAATLLLTFLGLLSPALLFFLIPQSRELWSYPWGFVTYPLISISGDAASFINLIFALLWLYFVGGTLERRWGTKRFLFSFFAFSAISAFFLAVGSLFAGIQAGLGGLFCPLVDLTVIWATLEPETPVLFFVFPMQLRWLAWIACGILLFQFGSQSPLFGVFALGGCAAAYLYSRPTTRLSRASPEAGSSRTSGFSLNPFEWYRRWRFKRRFKKLWGP